MILSYPNGHAKVVRLSGTLITDTEKANKKRSGRKEEDGGDEVVNRESQLIHLSLQEVSRRREGRYEAICQQQPWRLLTDCLPLVPRGRNEGLHNRNPYDYTLTGTLFPLSLPAPVSHPVICNKNLTIVVYFVSLQPQWNN